MFHYPYAANGDPNLDLLSAVSIGQPTNSSPPDHPPFFVVDDDVPFPAASSSSFPSSNDYFITHHRSTTTYSPLPPFCSSSSPASSAREFLDLHHRAEPVRRVYSTGDLQVPAENCTQEGAAAAPTGGRVGRYSTEERKERIERYRSKRNQRNFHKKITYACRKTLADSRPRVRGRFARNGEEAESSEASYECYSHNTRDNGGNFESAADGGDWLKQMQAALAAADAEEERCYEDEDVWAGLDSVFSMDLLS
ncbi:two-component response regulator-like APRR5 [Iris pallida]|uniref:Two-component response regulator-like APRR5 n=1 Tax=Iris pallida TaxID=29817 RepID=A0AAX6HU71_IRIPA|nr:two-component response regulator-like APRR5 [Iris pallida]